MVYKKQSGVPAFTGIEFSEKTKNYAVLIPIENEGVRIKKELCRAYKNHVPEHADIIICDGGSTDGCTEETMLRKLKVSALLAMRDTGGQGAQLRMGIWWALRRGYRGIITIDGNNKDSIEDIPYFIEKLEEGYDLVQGSRFVKGGRAVRTPLIRLIAVKCIHAPLISFAAHQRFTDTTNAFRAYSAKYLEDGRVQPLRDIFMTYELLAYLSVRASQIGMRVCEIPVTRVYPKEGRIPTKISSVKGNARLFRILLKNICGSYSPKFPDR